jgi:hypothetical protein
MSLTTQFCVVASVFQCTWGGGPLPCPSTSDMRNGAGHEHDPVQLGCQFGFGVCGTTCTMP